MLATNRRQSGAYNFDITPTIKEIFSLESVEKNKFVCFT